MNGNVVPLEELVNQFARLPGIGRKTARRLAYSIIEQPESTAKQFADALINAKEKIRFCSVCQNFTDKEVCHICSDEKRDRSTVCVVEDPRDVAAFERTREYKGRYHVLHGLISPVDGVTADQLAIRELLARLQDGTVKEVIMATNPTVEGEATAMYLSRLIKPLGIRTTRLASGLPVGSNLEYADEVTLYRALSGRGDL